MTDPSNPAEQPGVPPAGGSGPPYGATPASSPPPGVSGPSSARSVPSIPGLDLITRDAGAWVAAAVVLAVVVTIFSDLIYAVSNSGSAIAASGFSFSSNVTFRVHLLAFTEWATLGIAVALLVGVGLACFVKPSVPAPFRQLVVLAGSGLSVAVALFALIRAVVWLSYGHDYGFAAFVGALATIPVALVTAALGLGKAGPAS
jgi:hypothetical protein